MCCPLTSTSFFLFDLQFCYNPVITNNLCFFSPLTFHFPPNFLSEYLLLSCEHSVFSGVNLLIHWYVPCFPHTTRCHRPKHLTLPAGLTTWAKYLFWLWQYFAVQMHLLNYFALYYILSSLFMFLVIGHIHNFSK